MLLRISDHVSRAHQDAPFVLQCCNLDLWFIHVSNKTSDKNIAIFWTTIEDMYNLLNKVVSRKILLRTSGRVSRARQDVPFVLQYCKFTYLVYPDF